jgi:hypothetical protein
MGMGVHYALYDMHYNMHYIYALYYMYVLYYV